MQVINGLESAKFSRAVLTIGNFDGVHRGHQAILAAGRRHADARSAQLVVMTFDPHPSVILTPDRIPPTLTPFEEKMRCLQRAGVDAVVIVRSEPAFLNIPAADFVNSVIIDRFHPTAVVEGASFAFGHHRQGNVDTLREAGRVAGFDVEIVEPIRVALGGHPDTVISSSLIRHLLTSGTVDGAALCLGRPYALLGTVVKGAGRGRSLGFPTANVVITSQLIPSEGVYAGQAVVADQCRAAAVSIGRNPTFEGAHLLVEAHLLDCGGDLYDQPIRIEFLDWIRAQCKFSSVQELREQIARDVTRAMEAFQSHNTRS